MSIDCRNTKTRDNKKTAYIETQHDQPKDLTLHTGRVITRFGAELLVESDVPPNQSEALSGEPVRCTAKRKFDSIVCGDFITWHHNPQGNATVDDLLPRKNALTRPGYRSKPRTIAANIDLLLIVNSWLPELSWDLVDRYLIAAHQLKTDAVIVMNKSDLTSQYATDEDWQNMEVYEHIGYPVVHINALDGEGIKTLKTLMKDKTSILSGRSGVGKSSIANQILPGADINTGIISQSGEGKHTTTSANLYPLTEGGYLIDSPGVRDYALGDISFEQLANGYIEFHEYSINCRFNNCTHDHEPACEVRKAVENKQISELRYKRYLKALRDL